MGIFKSFDDLFVYQPIKSTLSLNLVLRANGLFCSSLYCFHVPFTPENNQICSKPWLSLNIITFNKDYECGLRTTNLLKKFVKNEILVCKKKSLDRYNRVVAICFKKRRDINSWLVRNGLAVAYTKYSKKYITNENDAKKEKKGLWAGNFEMPWEWRKKRK